MKKLRDLPLWKRGLVLGGVGTVLLLSTAGACDDNSTGLKKDNAATASQLDRYQKNQPVPAFDYSQYRQTLIDILQAQVHNVATTTFFFNAGSVDPISTCPSIGFGIPTTAQLTNPDQRVGSNNGPVTLPQMEPNGVYTGESSGTYVVCVAPSGDKYIDYWEGDVKTVGAPAHWDTSKHDVTIDGEPTAKVTTK